MSVVEMAKYEKRHDPRPQIPNGNYILEYMSHWTYPSQYGLKLVILFVIVEGDHSGTEIVRYYNVEKATGKREFKVSRCRALHAEMCAVFDGHIDTTKLRLDELPISRMKGLRIYATVRMPKKNRSGVPLVGGAAYSVVEKLIGSKSVNGSSTTKGGPIPAPAKPSLSLSPSPSPIPSGLAGKIDPQTVSDTPIGKNGATDKPHIAAGSKQCRKCKNWSLSIINRTENHWTHKCSDCGYIANESVREEINKFVKAMERPN